MHRSEGDDEDDEHDDQIFNGLTRPTLVSGGSSGVVLDEDEDEEGEAPEEAEDAEEAGDDDGDAAETGGLVGAEAAFDLDTAPGALELDPFRVAGPVESAATAARGGQAKQHGSKPVPKGKNTVKKLFVGGLPWEVNDAALVKFFVRFGKVQEAAVVKGEDGKSRGFGFVTFVHAKGAAFCLAEAGDPPQHMIGGRTCTVRYAEDRGNEVPHYKMPARGQYRPEPAQSKARERAPGGPSTAAGGSDGSTSKRPARHDEEDEAEGDSQKRKARKKKEEIVNVTRRQDAEPLYDRPITMRELFPKEFWRV